MIAYLLCLFIGGFVSSSICYLISIIVWEQKIAEYKLQLDLNFRKERQKASKWSDEDKPSGVVIIYELNDKLKKHRINSSSPDELLKTIKEYGPIKYLNDYCMHIPSNQILTIDSIYAYKP